MNAGTHRPLTSPTADRRVATGFFRPVDYSSRTCYRRPPSANLRLQWLGPLLTTLGISPKYVVTLEVPAALAGESEWVRNVRAAGGRVVIGRRERHGATLVEVPAEDRPAVIRAHLLRAGRRAGSRKVANEARYYFGLSADPALAEIRPVVELLSGLPGRPGRPPRRC